MNEVREGAAHKLKPIVSGITLSPSTSEIRLRTRTRTRYMEIIFYIGLRKIGNWVTGSNNKGYYERNFVDDSGVHGDSLMSTSGLSSSWIYWWRSWGRISFLQRLLPPPLLYYQSCCFSFLPTIIFRGPMYLVFS